MPEASVPPPRLSAITLVTPPAVQVNARRLVAVATGVWLLATVVLAASYGWLARHDHRTWLWTALAGTVLGVLGWSIMTRHARLGRTI